MNNIKLIRLVGGEIVIGKEMSICNPDGSVNSDSIDLLDARFLKIIPSPRGIGVALVKPFEILDIGNNSITIYNVNILKKASEEDIPKEFLNRYLSNISGIKVPSGGVQI